MNSYTKGEYSMKSGQELEKELQEKADEESCLLAQLVTLKKKAEQSDREAFDTFIMYKGLTKQLEAKSMSIIHQVELLKALHTNVLSHTNAAAALLNQAREYQTHHASDPSTYLNNYIESLLYTISTDPKPADNKKCTDTQLVEIHNQLNEERAKQYQLAFEIQRSLIN